MAEMLKTSDTAATVNRSKEFGVETAMAGIRWNIAVDRKNRVVKTLNAGVGQLLKARGVTVLKGRGTVLSEKQIVVQTAKGDVQVNCGRMILTIGAESLIPNIKGIDLAGVITRIPRSARRSGRSAGIS